MLNGPINDSTLTTILLMILFLFLWWKLVLFFPSSQKIFYISVMVLWTVFDLMVTSWGQVLGFWLLVWSTDRGSYSHQVLVKHWYLNDFVLLLLWFCGQYLNLMVTSWLWKHDTAITLVVSRIDVLFRAWHCQVWGFWLWLLVEVLAEDLLVLYEPLLCCVPSN